MQMPMNILYGVITGGKEKRIEGNLFQLTLEGYQLTLLDHPLPLLKNKNSAPVGKAVVKEVTWKENVTYLTYELIDLHGVN